jgi:hypothetical protein
VRFTLLLFCALSGISGSHPVYVSITQIDLKTHGIQVTIRTFADDIDKGLSRLGLKAGNESYGKYALLHLLIKGEKSIPLRYLGHEIEADAVYLYLEGTNISGAVVSEVEQRLLHEVYDLQTNIIHLQTSEGIRTGICTHEEPIARFNN